MAATPFSEEPYSKRASDEDELNLRITVRHEFGDELPVASIVETEAVVGGKPDAVSVKSGKRKRLVGVTCCVRHVERNVDVATVLMGGVTRDGSALFRRQLTHRELGSGDSSSDAVGGALQELNELPRAVESAITPRFWEKTKVGRRAKLHGTAKASAKRKAKGAGTVGEAASAGSTGAIACSVGDGGVSKSRPQQHHCTHH